MLVQEFGVVMIGNVKILIAGNDYFDNARCSVILDHLVLKINYNFLVKPEHLMSELAKDKYDLIVLALDMDKNVLQSFKKKFLELKTPHRCLFFGQYEKAYYQDFFAGLDEKIIDFPFLTTPFSPIKFTEALRTIINDTATLITDDLEIMPYVAIKLQFLRKYRQVPFDIYIQLSKDKYVKIRNRDDKLDDELITRYKSKGIKEFYLTINDFNSHHENIYTLPLIFEDQKTGETIDPERKIKEIHEVLIEIISDIGLNEIVINLAHQYTKNILEYSGSKASLALMLEASIKNDYSYIYDHSYMTSVICVKVCKKISWMTPAMEEKMCMGAVFHDLYLGHTKYPYKIDVKHHDINEIAKNDRGVYFVHPTEMATILSETDSIPQEVINIVSQHHEKVDGSGFPKKLSSLTMSPTVGLFIMVHDFVNELYKVNFDCQQYSILIANIVAKYCSGNFKEIAKAFERAMLEELHQQEKIGA